MDDFDDRNKTLFKRSELFMNVLVSFLLNEKYFKDFEKVFY